MSESLAEACPAPAAASHGLDIVEIRLESFGRAEG